jgi:hypothetical protein
MKSFSFWSLTARSVLFLGIGCGANSSATEQPAGWHLRITEFEPDAIDGASADRLIASLRRVGDRYEWTTSYDEHAWLPVNGSVDEVEAQLAAIEAASHSEGEAYAGESPITFSYQRGSSELRVSRTPSALTEGLRALQRAAVALIAAQIPGPADSPDPVMGGFNEGACAPEVHVSGWEDNGTFFRLCAESCESEGVRFSCISREESAELDRVILNSNGVERERFVAMLIERIRARIASGEVTPMLDPSDSQK